jgi:tRNA G18 (ribose-2'-O)-methylase SpoU
MFDIRADPLDGQRGDENRGVPVRIVDPGDPRLADYRQLRDAVARRQIEGDELFVAEGPVAIERMIASGHHVRSVLLDELKYERIADVLAAADAPLYVVDRDLLHEITGFDLHRGAIAAGSRRPALGLADLVGSTRRLVVLEGLNDPENLGAVARSARAFGFDGLVLDPTCLDPYTRRTVRVSMGEILHLRWSRIAADEWPTVALTQLAGGGFETWALTPGRDSTDIWTLSAPDRLAIALGAEGPGLSDASLRGAARRVRIPIRGDVDSLNVAAAAAVAFAVVSRR